MQIKSLKVFCDLVDTRSFSEAAKMNNITQSAVSQQIRNLENRYDVRFFERSRKNFSITPEGEAFLQYAKQIYQTYRGIEDKLEGLKQRVSGVLRVDAIGSVGLHDLQPVIEEFRKLYPEVELKVNFPRFDQIYRNVAEGKTDIGIVAYPTKAQGVVVDVFHEQELVLVCPPDHPLAKKQKVKLADLTDQTFVGFDKEQPSRIALDKALNDSNIQIDHSMEFDNLETIKRGILVSSALAILPEKSVDIEVSTGELSCAPIEDLNLTRPLATLRGKGSPTTRPMQEFVRMIKQEEETIHHPPVKIEAEDTVKA